MRGGSWGHLQCLPSLPLLLPCVCVCLALPSGEQEGALVSREAVRSSPKKDS